MVGWQGTVQSYNEQTRWFKVHYDDGDSEELSLRELTAVLLCASGHAQAAAVAGARKRKLLPTRPLPKNSAATSPDLYDRIPDMATGSARNLPQAEQRKGQPSPLPHRSPVTRSQGAGTPPLGRSGAGAAVVAAAAGARRTGKRKQAASNDPGAASDSKRAKVGVGVGGRGMQCGVRRATGSPPAKAQPPFFALSKLHTEVPPRTPLAHAQKATCCDLHL